MKRTTFLAAAIALAGPVTAWAQAQVSVHTPDAQEPVPLNGTVAVLPFEGTVAVFSPYTYCGVPQQAWTRDGADPKTCSGISCSVDYAESAASRGPHTARVEVSYWWTTALSGGQCIPGSITKSRSYVVQYPPTVQLTSAAWRLQAGQIASFSATGTIDPDYAVNDSLTYRWTFGDGTSASGPNVTHAWARCGDYHVGVSADDGALAASAMTQITVTSSNCTTKIK